MAKRQYNPYSGKRQYGYTDYLTVDPQGSIVYNPQTEWQPIEQDWEKQKEAKIKQETRENAAETSKDTLETEFGGYRDLLNMQDEETANWWNDLEGKIKSDIRDYSDRGDWAGAKRAADRWAAELKNNQELKDRIVYTKDYNAWVDDLKERLGKNSLSQEAYDWAIASNPYQFNRYMNDDGSYKSYDKWTSKKIYDKIDWDVIADHAAKDVPEDTSHGETRRADGSYSEYNTNTKKVEDIYEQAYNKFTLDQDFRQAVIQEAEIAAWALERELAKYAKDKDRLDKDIFIDQLAEYYIDPETNHTYYTLKGINQNELTKEQKAKLDKLKEERQKLYEDQLAMYNNGQKPSHDKNYYEAYIRKRLWRSSKNRAYSNSSWAKGEATAKPTQGAGNDYIPNITTNRPYTPGNGVYQNTDQGLVTGSLADQAHQEMQGTTSGATAS